MPQQEFVTIKQASQRLGVSPRTIRRWILEIGTKNITRGTAKRHTLEVDIRGLEQHTRRDKVAQEANGAKEAKEARKKEVAQRTKTPERTRKNRAKAERGESGISGTLDTSGAKSRSGTTDTSGISGAKSTQAKSVKPAQNASKKGRSGISGTLDTTDISDTQDIVPRGQYVSVLESKNEIIAKQDKHIAMLEGQLRNEQEQRKRSDILLAETLQKIPQLTPPNSPTPKKRKKFLGIF